MINNINYNLKYSVECLLGIERAILSSLITNNNTDKIEDCLKIIEPKDFYYEQHGIIYDSIILLYKNDQRVDENNVFLTNQTNINEQYYIDVIATTPLDSILDSIKKIKQYSLERQLITVAAKIKEGDFSQIINLNNLHTPVIMDILSSTSTLEFTRLSAIITLWSFLISSITVWLPINPRPPVTNIFICNSSFPLF